MSPEPDVGVRSIRLLSTSQYNPWDDGGVGTEIIATESLEG